MSLPRIPKSGVPLSSPAVSVHGHCLPHGAPSTCDAQSRVALLHHRSTGATVMAATAMGTLSARHHTHGLTGASSQRGITESKKRKPEALSDLTRKSRSSTFQNFQQESRRLGWDTRCPHTRRVGTLRQLEVQLRGFLVARCLLPPPKATNGRLCQRKTVSTKRRHALLLTRKLQPPY